MLQEYFYALNHFTSKPSSLLDSEAVVEQSKIFSFHPVVRELHAYMLDDENTSDHHFLITAEPLAGSVFFLSHDGDSRVVFESTADFLNAVRNAGTQARSVSDFHPLLSPVARDQAALTHLIKGLLLRECNDLVVSLVPSLYLADFPLLRTLVGAPDFFLGEAVAMEIAKRPSRVLLPIAMACAGHGHTQVSSAGSRALRRIQQIV